MKFLSVRDLKTKSSQVWKELPDQREMIITSNGRPIALLSSREGIKIISPSEFLEFFRNQDGTTDRDRDTHH